MTRKFFQVKKSLRKSRRKRDISDQALVAMAILVLIVSLLSVSMYLYALYGKNFQYQKEHDQSGSIGASSVAGVASLEILESPKEHQKGGIDE